MKEGDHGVGSLFYFLNTDNSTDGECLQVNNPNEIGKTTCNATNEKCGFLNAYAIVYAHKGK